MSRPFCTAWEEATGILDGVSYTATLKVNKHNLRGVKLARESFFRVRWECFLSRGSKNGLRQFYAGMKLASGVSSI